MPVTFYPFPEIVPVSIAPKKMCQSSGKMFATSLFENDRTIRPCRHGLVDTVRTADYEHRALILRPDDVWLGILTQLILFVNANAERMRPYFVVYKGQKRLIARTLHFDQMPELMAEEIRKNVVDPTLVDWNDTGAGSDRCGCGHDGYVAEVLHLRDEVCLRDPKSQGTKEDWEKILQRAARLKQFDEEFLDEWHKLLVPVPKGFVRAFDDPNGAENLTFWRQVCYMEEDPGCGDRIELLTGWLTAFDGPLHGRGLLPLHQHRGPPLWTL